jgi:serine/threonine-protein phosphatase Stp1
LVIENLNKITAASTIEEYTNTIIHSLEDTNSHLIEEAILRQYNMIGCTVVVMAVDTDRQFACLWAGDSRLYRLRDGKLQQVSKDHSEVQSLVERGAIAKDQAESHPSSNIINRAVGAKEPLTLEVLQGKIESGDKYLLCSDGLYREVSENEMEQCLQKQDEPDLIASKLMQLALDREAKDNVTVLAINFD